LELRAHQGCRRLAVRREMVQAVAPRRAMLSSPRAQLSYYCCRVAARPRASHRHRSRPPLDLLKTARILTQGCLGTLLASTSCCSTRGRASKALAMHPGPGGAAGKLFRAGSHPQRPQRGIGIGMWSGAWGTGVPHSCGSCWWEDTTSRGYSVVPALRCACLRCARSRSYA